MKVQRALTLLGRKTLDWTMFRIRHKEWVRFSTDLWKCIALFIRTSAESV